MGKRKQKALELDEGLKAYVAHQNQLRDLTRRAIQQSVRRNLWDQVNWGAEGMQCVLDLGPGDGYHFRSLTAAEKTQVIALERDFTMRTMLAENHPDIKLVAGDWNNLEEALGGRLAQIHTITGFNFNNYVKPNELEKLQAQLTQLPNIKRLLFINDLAPQPHWAASPQDIVETGEDWQTGIGAADKGFRDQDAMVRAWKRSFSALEDGLPDYRVEMIEDWSQIEAADPTDTQREAQTQEFERVAGMHSPFVKGPADLNVFMRMPGEAAVTMVSNHIVIQRRAAYGHAEPMLPEGKVKEFNILLGAQAIRG